MRNCLATLCIALALVMMAGCAATHETPPEIPPPVISRASFSISAPTTVVITGEFFKINSDNKKDVIVSLNGSNWLAATNITDSSPTSYTAVVPYGINYPAVWVRVYGMDNQYSAPYLIQGQTK